MGRNLECGDLSPLSHGSLLSLSLTVSEPSESGDKSRHSKTSPIVCVAFNLSLQSFEIDGVEIPGSYFERSHTNHLPTVFA